MRDFGLARGGRAIRDGSRRARQTLRDLVAERPRLRWLLPLLAAALLALTLSPDLAGLRRPAPAPTPPTRVEAVAVEAVHAAWAPEPPSPAAAPYASLPAPAADPEPEPLADVAALEPGPAADGPAEPARGAGGETYDCIIEPSERIEISSPVEGLIESIPVERSELIEAGQTLVELESGVERAEVELARARAHMIGSVRAREAALALQQRREDRVGRLFDSEALSLDLREQVETEAEIARRELEEARDTRQLASLRLEQAVAVLRRRQIRSPVSGVVVDRLMSPGEVVDNETILVVAQIDPLRVELVLPAALFGSVRPGARAAVEPELPGDRVYVASVAMVDRVIDAASGTFGVWLELPNPDHEIPSGLNCRARLLSE